MKSVLDYPFTLEKIRALKVGDSVALSGRIVTARDRVHWYLFEGGKSPVVLSDGALFHCGPVVIREGGSWIVRAAGPATSLRYESCMPRIIEQHHLRVIIGKGGMGEATQQACLRRGCIYIQTVGGAASKLAESITAVHKAHMVREFGVAEAMWELEASGMEGVVTIDSHGGNLHHDVAEKSHREFLSMLK